MSEQARKVIVICADINSAIAQLMLSVPLTAVLVETGDDVAGYLVQGHLLHAELRSSTGKRDGVRAIDWSINVKPLRASMASARMDLSSKEMLDISQDEITSPDLAKLNMAFAAAEAERIRLTFIGHHPAAFICTASAKMGLYDGTDCFVINAQARKWTPNA